MQIHMWFHHHYQYFHLENWVLSALVVIAMLFEMCWHTLTHHVEAHSGSHQDGHDCVEELDMIEHEMMDRTLTQLSDGRTETPESHVSATSSPQVLSNPTHSTSASQATLLKQSSLVTFAREVHQDFREESKTLYSTLTERCAGELMVLGFLAGVVWGCSRSGALFALACSLRDLHHIDLPDTAHGYVETIEDVHMHLFLTMVVFIAILTVSVFVMNRVSEKWRKYDLVIQKAVTRADPEMLKTVSLRDIRPKGADPRGFMYFAKSRRLLFGRLAYWLSNTDVSEDNKKSNTVKMLLTVLEELHSEKSPGKPFRKERLPELMDSWFSFQEYSKTMCHYLMVDLVEIKTATWLYLCCGLVTSALLLLATHKLRLHFVVIGVQLLVALVIGIAVPLYLRRQRSEEMVPESKLREEWIKSAKAAKKLEEDIMEDFGIDEFPELKFPRYASIEDFPMFTLQMFCFLWCYNIVRMCGSNYWWYTHPEWAGLALALLVLTIPLVGFIIGHIVASMALIMARGDMCLKSENLAWVYVLAVRELERTRRKNWIATQQAEKVSPAAIPAEGETHVETPPQEKGPKTPASDGTIHNL